MAVIFEVRYPSGEVTLAVGYPVEGSVACVSFVPEGPEACFLDEVELGAVRELPYPVRALRGGPRRPTLRVLLDDDGARAAWMDAREAEGWATADSVIDRRVVLIVAMEEALDPRDLARTGARFVDEVSASTAR